MFLNKTSTSSVSYRTYDCLDNSGMFTFDTTNPACVELDTDTSYCSGTPAFLVEFLEAVIKELKAGK